MFNIKAVKAITILRNKPHIKSFRKLYMNKKLTGAKTIPEMPAASSSKKCPPKSAVNPIIDKSVNSDLIIKLSGLDSLILISFS